MAAVLSICVLLFTIPAWWLTVSKRPISTAALKPILSFTLSSLLQIAFIVLVGKDMLPLSYSLKFAVLGIPFCVLALVLVRRAKQSSDPPRGVVAGAWLGLAMWMFLITLH